MTFVFISVPPVVFSLGPHKIIAILLDTIESVKNFSWERVLAEHDANTHASSDEAGHQPSLCCACLHHNC